jgi:Uma2 family endonuclease
MPMETELPRALLEVRYYQAAQEYLRKLPPEHFMEATPQVTQRKITLESLDLLHARRPEVHVFNELLVQYPLLRRKRPGQVVPDNMIVVHHGPIKAVGSYDVSLQPVGPFCVLEYVSKSNRRKDYDDNMRKYEHELKVPYYLLFVPEEEELTLYHHTGERFVSVRPGGQGRYAIPDLDLAVGLLDGWLRYWYQGELLPLPADLQAALDKARIERDEARAQRDEALSALHKARRELAETAQRADAAERQSR